MDSEAQPALLSEGDPSPVRVTNRGGRSLFLLLGDHAGNLVPRRMDALGLSPAELERHIAWDIGVSALGQSLAARLDAPFVEQRYSRLVVDCNRSEHAPDRMAAVSDGTRVPGNTKLSRAAIARRESAIFAPYHKEIARIISERASQGRATVVVSLHSFTPTWQGQVRSWDIGVLHDGGSTRFALGVFEELQSTSPWCIGDNVPYRMDETDYTVPRHCYRAQLPYVELEFNQNRLAAPQAIDQASEMIANALRCAAGYWG